MSSIGRIAFKEAQALGIGGQPVIIRELIGIPRLVERHEITSLRGEHSTRKEKRQMSEQEKRQNKEIMEKFMRMTDEQKKLWLAVGDGMLMAQDILDGKAS